MNKQFLLMDESLPELWMRAVYYIASLLWKWKGERLQPQPPKPQQARKRRKFPRRKRRSR